MPWKKLILNKGENIQMTSLGFPTNFCKRTYIKRFALVTACLVFLALVISQQYIKETETRHIHFVNTVMKKGRITTVRQNAAVTNDLLKADTLGQKTLTSNSNVLDVNLKPEVKAWINGTKTQYPLTVNAPYYMENQLVCSSVPNLSVLVIVHTAPDHFDRRQAMRDTWTNDSYYRNLGRVKVLFLLGRVNNPILQTKLEKEFKDHGDLLQGEFLDAYRNLTHKGVMGYKWISERCRNAKIILKVDDDIVVNMFKLFQEYVPKYSSKKKQIVCNRILPGTMLIIRDKTSKWHVDDNIFKGQKYYPRYCSGFMVIFTNDVIPAIYRSSSITPFFWVDDVYLYGLAPGNVPGIIYNNFKKGSHELNGQMALKCYRNASRTCDFLVTGAGKREVMEEIWNNMVKLYKKSQTEKKSATEATHILETSTREVFEIDTLSSKKPQNDLVNTSVISGGKNELLGKLVKELNKLGQLKHIPNV